jgi:predicted site-specific integrase-resolvase
MKKIKLYLLGQKYEIEMDDEFYKFIEKEIESLNNSQNQVKDLLNIMLSCKYKMYKKEKKIQKIIKKLEL